MKFEMTIMTCSGRESVLERTLASIRASDWDEEPVVTRDTTCHRDRRISQTATAFQILEKSLERDWDYLLFCEDDITVNRHLRHNLERWTPVKWNFCLVGTLYQGGADFPRHADYFLAPATIIGGSQAVVIRRDWLPELLRLWPDLHVGMQDMKIYQAVDRLVPHVYVHNPNLVQHQKCPSTWNGPAHSSPTFDEEWRAS